MPPTRQFPLLFCLFLLWPGLTGAGEEEFNHCRRLWLTGQYEQCIQLATEHEKADLSRGDRFSELKAQAQAATGKYADACETLKESIARHPLKIRNRWLLLELGPYAEKNWEIAAQKRQFEAILNGRGGPLPRDPANLVALAEFALTQRADPKQVEDVLLRKARADDPKNIEPWLVSGRLALDKRDFALAAENFTKAREMEPEHPEALFGMAQALAESDQTLARKLLQETLAINSRHAGALLAQAENLIHAEHYSAAFRRLDDILAVNPRHPEALALQSAILQLQNNGSEASKLRTQALAAWESNPRVDFLIGRTLSEKYHFTEGSQAQRQALQLQPNYLPALKQLAQDLLRLGQEAEGWQLADSVYQRDQYDIASYNLITLRDELEKFATLERNGLLVRMDRREAEVYGERVLQLLEEAKQTLGEKYAVSLNKPVLIEIFPRPADFAVRTFGLPGAGGYLGVCFGDVVTARSSTSENVHPINWESVLWHEFAHVLTLNKTHHQLPRWLSEGISVYEERQRDSRWGERMNSAYQKMIEQGELVPISQLSGAFLAPPSPHHLMFAYFESSLVVEYIVNNYGHSALLAILDDLAIGMKINEAIPRHTVPMPELEKEFAAFVKRASRLYNWSVEKSPVDFEEMLRQKDPVHELLAWARRHPRHYAGLTRCGELLLTRKHPAEAADMFQRAAGLVPQDTGPRSALAQLAELQQQTGDPEERETLEQLIRWDDKAAGALQRLLELNMAGQNWDAVQDHADRLISVRPMLSQSYAALAAAAEHYRRPQQATAALQTLLKLEPADSADLHYRMAVQYHQQHDQEKARRHVLQSLEQAPRYRSALQLLLDLQKNSSSSP